MQLWIDVQVLHRSHTHRPAVVNDSSKKELSNLKVTLGQRNEKIKILNAEKIALQDKVKALESRLEYFEQFKNKTRHQVGTDVFLKIIEAIGK